MTTQTGASSALRGGDTTEPGTGGHEAVIGPDDQLWLRRVAGDADRIRVRMQLATDSDTDTEGHAAAGDEQVVLVTISNESDDTEGHALALHFPTVGDAQAFKKGVAAGALAATLIVGGAVGAASLSRAAAAAPPAAQPAVHRVAFQLDPQPVLHPRSGRAIPQ